MEYEAPQMYFPSRMGQVFPFCSKSIFGLTSKSQVKKCKDLIKDGKKILLHCVVGTLESKRFFPIIFIIFFWIFYFNVFHVTSLL